MLTDPVFGPLIWHEGFLAWLGQVEWSPGLVIEVLLGLRKDGTGDSRPIRASWDWLRSHEPQVRRTLADDVLDWCNEEFAREGEPLDMAEFLAILELHQLRLEVDGSLWVLYNDAHHFGGHVFWADYGPDKVFRGTSVD